MSISVNTTVSYGAGGSSRKYVFSVAGSLSVNQNGDEADFTFSGRVTITNYPNGPRNIWQASDFAAFLAGATNLANSGRFGNCYKHSLPYAGNGSTSGILLEFRGDTFRGYGPNSSSLWARGSGMLLDTDESAFTRSFNFHTTYHLRLTRDPQQVVLGYNSSGANSSSDMGWIEYKKWVLVRNFMDAGEISFDYRPGERLSGGWKSLNRDGGVCERLSGGWTEMRTEQGTGNPPEICKGSWVNMEKL